MPTGEGVYPHSAWPTGKDYVTGRAGFSRGLGDEGYPGCFWRKDGAFPAAVGDPVHGRCFFAGGGPAGLAAAVAAARQGLRVFLAKRNICFGGMGAAGILPVFMPFGDGEHLLAAGAAAALAAQLKTDPRSIPIPELPKRLKFLGADLPNAPG